MYLIFFILGTIIASFLGVLIQRIPEERDFVKGRSQCDFCNTELSVLDLIPIISFVFNKGRCRYCKKKLSNRYLIIEVLTGIAFVLIYKEASSYPQLIIQLIFTSILIVIAYIDIDTMLIYDRFHIYILALGLVDSFINPETLKYRFLGAFVVSIPYFILAKLTNGIGMGDVKLSFSGGFFLAYPNIVAAFIISIIIAGIHAIYLLPSKKVNMKSAVPFGPYLCIAFFLSMLYGNRIIFWYLSLLF